MEDHTEPAAPPTEFNVVLESPKLSDEEWERSMKRLLWKAAMRRQPTPRKTFTISFSDQPDFFIVEEFGKG